MIDRGFYITELINENILIYINTKQNEKCTFQFLIMFKGLRKEQMPESR